MRASMVAALLLPALAAFGCASHPAPQGDAPPTGRLGHPLGTYLTIEGTRAIGGKTSDGTMRVDRVNGAELEAPVTVPIENLRLPEEARCRVSGYETAQWIGVPPGVPDAERVETQAAWQLYRTFVATAVHAPAELATQLAPPRDR